jgi:glycosyltransferase involved in cell wall biosynthesis
MIILISSKIDQFTIKASLGKPEYSYFFLLKSFLPALEQVGQVISVERVEDVDGHYTRLKASGEDVVFLSFSPPHQVPLHLQCPTISVFAWEFDSFPSANDTTHARQPEGWREDPHYNWCYVFARIAGAIATSQAAADLVAASSIMPVLALPAPVWGAYAGACPDSGWPLELGRRRLSLAGDVIDTHKLRLDPEQAVRRPESEAMRISRAMWQGWWREVRLPRLPPREVTVPEHPTKTTSVSLKGVLYTSVLNPKDGRKNWVEMITAFCWAFRDVEDATLLLKMAHHDVEQYRGTVLNQLARLMPFRCRVIVCNGFLEDAGYTQLIKTSTYYVNASSGEGLCLPLLEFLCCGRPALAPRHTAMTDYLRAEFSFEVSTRLEPDYWPHDPAGRLLTRSHRLNWQSLVTAFRSSYQQAADQSAYLDASRAARAFMQDFCAPPRIAAELASFLRQVLADKASKRPVEVDQA